MSSSRAFSYSSTGGTISGTKKLTNLYIQDSAIDYSSKPGGITWWQGPDEDLGYVIATKVTSENQPSPLGNIGNVKFWRTNGFLENEFIALAQTITGQTFLSWGDAKTWLNSNDYWTSFEESITNGIEVYLDSGNTASYSGSGTTWSDLSGNGNNATLYNSPTYGSLEGGSLRFDNMSYQWASIPDIGDLNTWTIECFYRLGESLNGIVSSLITNQYNLASKLNFSLGTNNAPTNYNLTAGFFNGAWRNTEGFSPNPSEWYQAVGTYDGQSVKFYSNGLFLNQFNYIGTPQSGGQIRIARRWDDADNISTNFMKTDISVVRIYNRALRLDEVKMNFNAQRYRYSL